MDTSQYTRRRSVQLLMAGGAAALLAACAPLSPQAAPTQPIAARSGSTTTPDGTPNRNPASTIAASTSTQQPIRGGTIRFGQLGDFNTLDGHFWYGGVQFDTLGTVWDRLVELDEQANPVPSLAESFEVSADYKQVVLHLRKGVQFHTGRELTSDDVKWNYARVKDPKIGGGITAAAIRPLSSMDTPDKYTVVFNSDNPWPGIFTDMTIINIVDPVTLQGPETVTHPVGTGPYVFAEYVQGDHLKLTRNPNYWQSGRPYPDELNLRIFSDSQGMISALETGAIDIAETPPGPDFVRLRQDPSYQAVLNPLTGAITLVMANLKTPPLDNKLLRQAINYGADRARMLASSFNGLGEAKDLDWAPSSPAYEPSKNNVYQFDLDKAKSALQRSGVPNPRFDLNFLASPEYTSSAQILQADLATVGITLDLKPLDAARTRDATLNGTWSGLFLASAIKAQMHPTVHVVGPYYDPNLNWENFHEPGYADLVQRVITTVDPTQAKQTYSEFNDYILDQSFCMCLNSAPQRVLARSNVHGIRYSINEYLLPTEMWVS